MTFETGVFYFFSTVLLLSATAVITIRNPVQSALFLVLSFFTASGIWMMLEAEFLAITLVLVYVGAVMVLFLFVVMMLDINLARLREGFWSYLPLGGLIALLLVVEMILVLGARNFGLDHFSQPVAHGPGYSNTAELGMQLYTTYVYPFELAAVILLVAIVAAIALTMRRRRGTKYQNPGQQIHIDRATRVRIVKMDVEKSPPVTEAKG